MASLLAPQQSEQLRLFAERLPHRPYCTDSLPTGIRPRLKVAAMGRRYIQPNAPVFKAWLVYDVDRPGAAFAWEVANLPPPTWTATNPENGHAHIAYGIEHPVCITENARAAPLRFAGAIDAAYCEALRADGGYSGLICKNPLHPHWQVLTPGDCYDLTLLSEYVDLNKYRDRRRKLPEYGLGRNCTVFEWLRKWSYRAIRDYWGLGGGYGAWFEACLAKAERLNTFDSPLPYSEIKATAKSVSKWVWAHFTPAEFSAVQAARGRLSGLSRAAIAQERAEKVALLASQGLSKAEIAETLGISQRHVFRVLGGMT